MTVYRQQIIMIDIVLSRGSQHISTKASRIKPGQLPRKSKAYFVQHQVGLNPLSCGFIVQAYDDC